MFKAIAAERPYPPSGLSTALWAGVPVEAVAVRALIATQGHLHIAALRPEHRGSHSGDPLVHVVKWRGELYLEDGHHRIVREALAGSAVVRARVLDLDVAGGDGGAADGQADLAGLVWVHGKGFRSPHFARSLPAHRVDWHRWSPGTEERHKALPYKDVA